MSYTAIIILNYNNYSDTINCIESVKKYNTAKVKYFVVDNASPDKNCIPTLDKYFKEKFNGDYLHLKDGDETERKSFPSLTFITSNINDGYARGNNKALKYVRNDSEAEYILILNNDILFIQDIIPQLISKLNTLPEAGIVSPLLLKKDHKTIDYNCARRNASITNIILWDAFLALHIPIRLLAENQYILKLDITNKDKDSVEIELPSGSCMLVKSNYFYSIGCFDPNTFMFYEENILFWKIKATNKINYLIPNLICIHLGGQSTKQNASYKFLIKSFESQKYYINNYSGANILQRFLYRISINLFTVSKFCSSSFKKIFFSEDH